MWGKLKRRKNHVKGTTWVGIEKKGEHIKRLVYEKNRRNGGRMKYECRLTGKVMWDGNS